MFSLLSNILNYFFINFYAQVSPAYDAASRHLSSKGIQGAFSLFSLSFLTLKKETVQDINFFIRFNADELYIFIPYFLFFTKL